jgi:hypothetical protein
VCLQVANREYPLNVQSRGYKVIILKAQPGTQYSGKRVLGCHDPCKINNSFAGADPGGGGGGGAPGARTP